MKHDLNVRGKHTKAPSQATGSRKLVTKLQDSHARRRKKQDAKRYRRVRKTPSWKQEKEA